MPTRAVVQNSESAGAPVISGDTPETLGVPESKGPLIHRVAVGGADFCVAFGNHNGCDANFSLIARMYADGSVDGEYIDVFSKGSGGMHIDVTCLSVDGNKAWIGGVVSHGNLNGVDVTGYFVQTMVVDNGTSGDQISYTYFDAGPLWNCTDQPALDLFDMTGQVSVKSFGTQTLETFGREVLQ